MRFYSAVFLFAFRPRTSRDRAAHADPPAFSTRAACTPRPVSRNQPFLGPITSQVFVRIDRKSSWRKDHRCHPSGTFPKPPACDWWDSDQRATERSGCWTVCVYTQWEMVQGSHLPEAVSLLCFGPVSVQSADGFRPHFVPLPAAWFLASSFPNPLFFRVLILRFGTNFFICFLLVATESERGWGDRVGGM